MADVYGLEVADLPAGCVAVRCLVVVETFHPDDPEGDTRRLSTRVSDGLTMWDVMGLAQAAYLDAAELWRTAKDADE